MLLDLLGAHRAQVIAVPTGLTKTSSTSTSIDLSWTNGNGTKQTRLFRDGALVTTLAAGVNSYSDTGRSASTGYTYTLQHIGTDAYSPFSVAANLFTSINAPGNPTNSVSVRDVTVSWSNTTGLAAIELRRDSVLITTLAAGTTSYLDAGLADASYNYDLRYNTGSDTSAYTATTTAVVAASVATPTGFSATDVDDTHIDLAWTTPTSGATTKVYRGTSVNPTTLIATVASGTSTYADSGLSPSTTYHYRLINAKSGVDSSYTADFTAATVAAPPSPPTGLTLTTPFSDRVHGAFTVADAAATTEIYRGASANPTALLTSLGTTVATFDDDTAVQGTTYHYRMRHLKGGAYSTYSADVSVTTPVPALSSQNLVANVGDTDAVLSWGVTNPPRSVSYNLRGSTDSDGSAMAGQVGATSPWPETLGYTVRAKNPGVTHEVTNTFIIDIIDGASAVVATDSTHFFLDVYKDT